jgi:hypothetical protein
MAKKSARKAAAGGAQPPRRTSAPPVRSKGAPSRPSADRRRWLIGGGIVAVLAVIGIVLGITLTGGSSSKASTTGGKVIPWDQIPGLQTDAPPWNSSSAVLGDRLDLLDLKRLGQEGTEVHIHQHLDLWVDGKKVTVPALIGIDSNAGFLTELHTHTPDGIIHVESPTKTHFTLGQFFGEWGVKLTGNCVGRYCGKVSWWVNGKKMTGNPAQLILDAHQEIVIAEGKAPAKIPSSYTFPEGL